MREFMRARDRVFELRKNLIDDWRFRPHGSLNGLTPEEFTKAYKEQQKTPETQLTSCAV